MKITKLNKELLKEMNGCEILSIHYEGCVLIKDDQVIQSGKQIDILNTNKKIESLWNEEFKNMMPYVEKELLEEFGY